MKLNLGVFIVALSLTIAITIGAIVFGPMIVGGMRAKQVLATGVTAEAKVTQLTDTGVRYNYQPYFAIHLEVMPAGKPPFAAVVKQVLPSGNAGPYAPGRMLVVKYDPAHPDQVAIVRAAPETSPPRHPAP